MVSKLNIKEEMRALDTRDRSWWNSLSEEDQEMFGKSMWTQMRFASSVQGKYAAHYLTLVNEFANVHFNILRNHPQLQHQLLQISGVGSSQFHEWVAPGKRGTKNKLEAWIAEQYPQYNDDEIALLICTTPKEEFVDIMEQQGMSSKDIKNIFK